MTPQGAIEIIKIAIAEVEWNYPMEYAEAFENAIEALEKQIPKKLNNIVLLGSTIKTGKCPKCNDSVNNTQSYCDKCGQALDWGDKE